MAFQAILTNQTSNVDNSNPKQVVKSASNNVVAVRVTGTFGGAHIVISVAPTVDGSTPHVPFIPVDNGQIYQEGVYNISVPIGTLVAASVKSAGATTSLSVGIW